MTSSLLSTLDRTSIENLEFACQTKISLAQVNKARRTAFDFLKPKQAECLKVCTVRDTVAVLPTGYGKSLVFEVLPYFLKVVRQLTETPTILIVSPLNSIIDEQLERYGDLALRFGEDVAQSIKGGVLTGKGEVSRVNRITDCGYTYVIGHPEKFLDERVNKLFLLSHWQRKVQAIVIDEVHCVVQWGEGFREKFRQLNSLRAFFNQAYVLGLTATATAQMCLDISKYLCLQNHAVVSTSVDRPNIKISVKKRLPTSGSKHTVEESYNEIFHELKAQLRKDPDTFPKTVVYTKLNWCGVGYEETVRPPKEQSACPSDFKSDLTEYVAQYHSPCTSEMRTDVLKAMSSTDGKLKLLFATEAYSMGTDAPDIRRVVHIGVPTTLETYIQEIGRAGRDGKQSTAVLHYNNSDLAQNKPGMTETMRSFCRLQSCRRAYICKKFDSENHQFDQFSLHNCCDICEKSCMCDICVAMTWTTSSGQQTDVCDCPEVVRDALMAYFHAENSLYSNGAWESGLCIQLAVDIAKYANKYQRQSALKDDYPQLEDKHLENVSSIINQLIYM